MGLKFVNRQTECKTKMKTVPRQRTNGGPGLGKILFEGIVRQVKRFHEKETSGVLS